MKHEPEPIDEHIEDVVASAVTAERLRIRRLLAVPALNALRCIPDGGIRRGCLVHDGKTVRERLRAAFLAIEPDDES